MLIFSASASLASLHKWHQCTCSWNWDWKGVQFTQALLLPQPHNSRFTALKWPTTNKPAWGGRYLWHDEVRMVLKCQDEALCQPDDEAWDCWSDMGLWNSVDFFWWLLLLSECAVHLLYVSLHTSLHKNLRKKTQRQTQALLWGCHLTKRPVWFGSSTHCLLSLLNTSVQK